MLIRYADDLVACCHSRQQATQVKARLAGWLAPRGLAFNEDQTRIVHLTEGFDFLGVNLRRYPNGKLLIKPSAPAVRRLKRRLAAELRVLRGSNVTAVLAKLVPITRGWAASYRTVVSSQVFRSLDHYVWKLLHTWAKHSHGNKPGPGSSTGTSPSSTSSGATGGCSATATAAPIRPGSPGLPSSGTPWSRAARPPMTLPGRVLGHTAAHGQPPARHLHAAPAHQAGRALPALRGPPAHRAATPIPGAVGTMVAAGHPAGDSRQLPPAPRGPGSPDGDQTRLVHAACHRGHLARRAAAQHSQPEPPSRLA